MDDDNQNLITHVPSLPPDETTGAPGVQCTEDVLQDPLYPEGRRPEEDSSSRSQRGICSGWEGE